MIYMYILIPTECNSIETMESGFNSYNPLRIQNRLQNDKNVTVLLPKFRIESQIDFNPILTKVSRIFWNAKCILFDSGVSSVLMKIFVVLVF